MGVKQYIPLLLIGTVILFIALIMLAPGTGDQGIPGKNSTAVPAPLPKIPVPDYPPDSISATVEIPQGNITINATVPGSPANMPVYRLNMSSRSTFFLDRTAMSGNQSSQVKENILKGSPEPLDDAALASAARDTLIQYHRLPPDATVHSIEKKKSEPFYVDGIPYRVLYVQVIFGRTINGTVVENWGIDDESWNHKGYWFTDHDFTIAELRKNGDPLVIRQRWTTPEYVRDEPVITAREALERLKLGQYSINKNRVIRDLRIHTIRQGYLEATGYTSIIEPAWIFYGNDFSGDGTQGENQTIVVLARKHDSADLPFFNGDAKDPALSAWPPGHKVSWYRVNISIEQATDIVKRFSGNSHLLIINATPFKRYVSCGDEMPYYNITTDDGIYIVDPLYALILSITYPIHNSSPGSIPAGYPDALNTSADFIREKFGNYSFDDLARNPDITEYPDSYLLKFRLSGSIIHLSIDKHSGDLISVWNDTADNPVCKTYSFFQDYT